MLPSETMIWQPEFTDKTLSRKTGAVQCVIHWHSWLLSPESTIKSNEYLILRGGPCQDEVQNTNGPYATHPLSMPRQNDRQSAVW
ncbi:hypothetical protein F7F68_19110 [Escherichia coli]|nr:hypothetical protein F7F68_19110 [Escherichia coli]